MPIKAVLMDMDGTLVKFNLDYLSARKKALQELERAGLRDASATEEISIYLMLKKLKPRLSTGSFEELRTKLYSFLEDAELDAAKIAKPIPGALHTVNRLRSLGISLALVTNSGRPAAELTLRNVGLSGSFDATVTRDDSEELKPDGGIVRLALHRLGISSEQAILVGDAHIDALAARSAGVLSVAIPSGPFPLVRILSAEPDFLLGSVIDLPMLLSYLNGI